jgi:hypothetical protein
MSWPAPFLVSVIIGVLFTGCGGAHATSPPPTATPSRPVHLTPVAAAAHQITLMAHVWEGAFAASRWGDVRTSFTSKAEGQALVGAMVQWRQGRVRALHIVPTHVQLVSAGHFIGTLRFTDDPRAVPIYRIYTFTLHGPRTWVTGTTTGLVGSSFANVRWSITRSAHFVILHSPYEVEGSDRQYLADLEYQRTQVEHKFGLQLPSRASYYLYPRTSLMAHLTAKTCGANPDNVGCTNPYTQPPSIQTSVWPTYHEPIHVYELALEPPPTGSGVQVAPLFIAEGTAVALEDRAADPRLSDYCSTLIYIPLDVCARVGVGETRPSDLMRDPGFKHARAGDAYALSGSFVKYLILKYGYRPFGKFYYTLAAQKSDTVHDYNVATYAIYHTSITRLLGAWQHQLCAGGCD